MTIPTNRRGFLKATGAAAGVALASRLEFAAEKPASSPSNADKLGWRLSCCAYTFRQFSFLEAIEKIAALGIRNVEGFSWQPVGKQFPGVVLDEKTTPELRKELKKRLGDVGMNLVNCYLRGFPKEEDGCRKIFEFGAALGMETFVAEPPPETLDPLAKLADEYKINLAIHNHPKPSSRYWNPETLLEAVRNKSKRLGACADTGHWCRSGLRPVEALKLLEGRVISFHLKDVVEFGAVKSADCPWGEGQGDILGILKEVHRQKAKVVFGIEYERQGDIDADLKQSIDFFEKAAKELANS